MLETDKILKFAEYFSIVTVGENKKPNFVWKKTQNEKLSRNQLIKQVEYKGGHVYTNKEGEKIEQPATKNFGLITGFEDLECMDVDLKVLSTTKEKETIWNEILSLLRDAIFDFDEKFVIYKTQSEGFHILYKTKRFEGNLKIASLKGHKEAIAETRGRGGYVFAYPEKKYSEKSYFDIEYISDQDRDSLMKVFKSFNYEEPKDEIKPPIKKKFQNDSQSKTPWEDFDEKNNVWDVVCDDFTVVKDTPKRIFIKRHNATSAHSGYIYKDDNLLYLFSTGTIFPHEKQITPSSAFAYKYHNGDFSASAKDLYEQGFGERLKSVIKEVESKIEINEDALNDFKVDKNDLKFPLDVFPLHYQNYILECRDKLDGIVDFMACSLLWAISLCIGNSFQVKIKNGHKVSPTVWFALVGKAGTGKTPSIGHIIRPLKNKNASRIKDYIKKNNNFKEYDKLNKKDKEEVSEVRKPNKQQFIANDVTLEALVQLHEHVPSGVGVFKDELSSWFKDMNKYREGSDMEFWLSTWSGESVSLVRVTRDDSFIENPFIPVLGGIQPDIFSDIYTEETKANGFIDRMLISYPKITIPEKYNRNEISLEAIKWYDQSITSLYDKMKELTTKDSEGNIVINEAILSEGATEIFEAKFTEIAQKENSSKENEYFKSMYPKQKNYIPRFAFLLHVLESHQNDIHNISFISKEAMEGACRLSDYFVAMAKKSKLAGNVKNDLKKNIKDGKTNFDKIRLAYKTDPEFNRTELAEIMGVSRRTIINNINKLEDKK